MNTSEMTITVLEATQGEFLTQTDLKEGEEPVFITKAFLAQDSTPADWCVATSEEKEAHEKEKDNRI